VLHLLDIKLCDMTTKTMLNTIKDSRGMNKNEMAEAFGVTRHQMYRYLDGRCEMPLDSFCSGIKGMGYGLIMVPKSHIIE